MLVYLVLVLYEPENDAWKTIVSTAIKSGLQTVIIDNSSSERHDELLLNQNVFYIFNNENVGIAKAQNIGLGLALDNNADAVCFFDQDSVVSIAVIHTMIDALMSNEVDIAVPVPFNKETNLEYPNHIIGKMHRFKDIYCNDKRSPYEVDIAISSGSFIKTYVFKDIGFFKESLFIDFVDIEWCLRCRRNGYRILVIPKAKMEHSIGKGFKKVGPITISCHSPYRTYYKVRNAFLLRKYNAGFLLTMWQVLPAIVTNFFLIFGRIKGKEYAKYYFHGVFDGIFKREGKYEQIHHSKGKVQ